MQSPEESRQRDERNAASAALRERLIDAGLRQQTVDSLMTDLAAGSLSRFAAAVVEYFSTRRRIEDGDPR